MSRFFRGNDSSSEEESDSGSSSEEEQQVKTTAAKTAAAAPTSKFSKGGAMADSSSDEDEGPRVVKSQKEKRTEEFLNAVKETRAHLKQGDWVNVLSDFEKLLKIQAKFSSSYVGGMPEYYVKVMAEMDDKLTEVVGNKEETRKMKPAAAKAVTALKQRLRKYVKEADVDKAITDYRANPEKYDAAEAAAVASLGGGKKKGDDSDDDEDDSDEEESSSEDEKAKAKKAPAPVAAAKPAATSGGVPSKFAKKAEDSESSEEDDDDDDDDDDEDWSDSGSDDGAVAKTSGGGGGGASKWLKKEPVKKAATVQKKKDDKPKQVAKREEEDEKEAAPSSTARRAAPAVVLTEEAVEGKLKEIIALRGKKGTDRKDQISQLQMLLQVTKNPVKQAQILVHLTSAQFDVNSSLHSHMSVEMWRRCFANIEALLKVVTENADVVLNEEGVGSGDSAQQPTAEEGEGGEDGEQPAVMGNLLAFLERLDEELFKSLQLMESHSSDYARRLQDTAVLLKLAEGVHDYYVGIGNLQAAARCSMRRLEHLYFRSDHLAAKASGSAASSATVGTEASKECEMIESLCAEIFKFGDDRTKTRALLCQVFYHAIHDRYAKARDLLLMSHLQETVQQTDETTIIMYNRATAALGLAAFRAGLINDAHSLLADICGMGRTREFLAQGLAQNRYERSPEQERFERRRMMPYHLHIDLDLLECCHLVSALLIEIPHAAANSFDSKRKVISKPLRRLFENFDRQILAGPPESMRETVMTAARALKDGDWKRCADLILNLSVWAPLRRQEEVKAILKRKIQEEGLRTYLFTFAQHYDAMSATQLCEIFELPQQQVHSIVSRMIIGGELHASWDQSTNSLVMHRVDPSRLQFFALQFADKAQLFVENNERIAEARFGAITASNKDRHGFFFAGGSGGGGNAGREGGHQQQQQQRYGSRGGHQGGGGGGRQQHGGDRGHRGGNRR